MAGAGVGGSFHPVVVVAAAFDDAGVGAVPPGWVEVLPGGDVGHDPGQDLLAVRGKRPGQ